MAPGRQHRPLVQVLDGCSRRLRISALRVPISSRLHRLILRLLFRRLRELHLMSVRGVAGSLRQRLCIAPRMRNHHPVLRGLVLLLEMAVTEAATR